MAIKFDLNGLLTNVNLDGARQSLTTFTAARKFIAADPVQSHVAEVTSNAEHIIDQASGLKSIAMVADQAAKAAAENIAKIRASLLGEPGVQSANQDPAGRSLYSFSDHDAIVSQRATTQDIMSRIGAHPVHVQDRLDRVATDIVRHSVGTFLPIRDAGHIQAVFNTAVPEVDHISVELDKKKGTIDCFYSRIVFSLPRQKVIEGKVNAVRIFRSTIDNPEFMKDRSPLSLHGIERLQSEKPRSRIKVDNRIQALEHRLRENGIANALSQLIPVDPLQNLRSAATSKDQLLNVPPPILPRIDNRNEQLLQSFVSPALFAHLDQSVISDVRVLKNIQLQNPMLVRKDLTDNVRIGRSPATLLAKMGPAHAQHIMRHEGPKTTMVVEPNNKQEFKELTFVSPDRLSHQVVGDHVEFTFDDETISYGKGYRYYLSTIDNNMQESVRSRIVEINVDGLRIPECPRRVFAMILDGNVSMNIQVDDLLVEKFEIFRKESDPGQARAEERPVRLISSDLGFTTDMVMRQRGANNFIQIAECLNGMGDQGANFFDRTVQRGQKYVYRVYSVDVFGNKSECPYEFAIFVPEPTFKPTELRKPNILLEVDAATNKAKVTIQCDDPRIEGLFLGRRDLTLKQSAFVPPGQVNRIKFGATDNGQGGRRFEDVRLVDRSKDIAWTGYFENNGQQIVFVDQNVTMDHTYQYRVYGVDRYGNQTTFEYSKPVAIVRRPFLNSPINLVANVVPNGDAVAGVSLSWTDANQDIAAEEKIGDQDDLAASKVRTLFQVERRKLGEDRWQEFPLTEETTFFDPSEINGNPPNFRPEYVKINQRYIYRVEAIQTGAFISNFSSPVEVFVGFSILPPIDFRAKASDTKARPFYVMLNWNTDTSSGVPDKWEIERAEVNNIAAARLNLRNPLEFEKLDFKPFRTVFREASRFRSIVNDAVSLPVPHGTPFAPFRPTGAFSAFQKIPQLAIPSKPIAITRGRGTIIGEHHYMDTAIVFGNTYFYRIRAIDSEGIVSDWAYKGIKVTDETFEKKADALITNDERVALAQTPLGMRLAKNQTLPSVDQIKSSLTLTPPFAKPVPPPAPPAPPAPPYIPPILRPTLPPIAINIQPIPRPPPYSVYVPPPPPKPAPFNPFLAVGKAIGGITRKIGSIFRF